MKTIRSIGIFLLAAALCAGFTGCVPLGRMVAERMEESIMDYKDASTFTAGNFTYAASDVRRVSVRWIDGSVTLKPGTGTLHADESGVLRAAADALAHQGRHTGDHVLRVRLYRSFPVGQQGAHAGDSGGG